MSKESIIAFTLKAEPLWLQDLRQGFDKLESLALPKFHRWNLW